MEDFMKEYESDKTTYEDCRELTNRLNLELRVKDSPFIYFLGGDKNSDTLYIEQVRLDGQIRNAFAGGTPQSTYNCLIAMHSMIESYPLSPIA